MVSSIRSHNGGKQRDDIHTQRPLEVTHRDPWWWHTETPGSVRGNRHTRPTFWMMRRSSPSLSMLDTESPRPREGCRGALGESGDCRSRVGSKPSHTITNIWSLTLLRARTASWCVAPIRLVPFTYNDQSEGWDLLCDWPSTPQASYHSVPYLQNPLSHLQSSVPRHSTITVDLWGKNSTLTPPIQLCTSTHCWDTMHHV